MTTHYRKAQTLGNGSVQLLCFIQSKNSCFHC